MANFRKQGDVERKSIIDGHVASAGKGADPRAVFDSILKPYGAAKGGGSTAGRSTKPKAAKPAAAKPAEAAAS
jgi:hypothetical protein